jgi:dihydroceramidase
MNKTSDSNGYWGNPTATIDWCEENYEITNYIAEFWNTISNLLMILLPLYGIYWSLKLRSKYSTIKRQNKNLNLNPHFINNLNIPLTIVSCHVGLALVGIGSWFFHMTLLYSMQLLDEIPMLWGSALIIYANYDLLSSTFKQTKRTRALKYLVLILDITYCLTVTYIYVYYLTNPIFHEISYGLQVAVIIIESAYLIKKLKLSARLYLLSFAYYLFGFLLWNIDNQMCDYLKLYRVKIDGYIESVNDLLTSGTVISLILTKILNFFLIFFKSFSQFHSLWHLFTGYGSYLTILFILDAYYEAELGKRLLVKSFQKLDINENFKIQRLKNRPVRSKWFSLIFELNHDFISVEKKKGKSKNY